MFAEWGQAELTHMKSTGASKEEAGGPCGRCCTMSMQGVLDAAVQGVLLCHVFVHVMAADRELPCLCREAALCQV